MSGSFSTASGNTTLTFQYVATTAKMLDIITNAAHALYDLKYNYTEFPFDTLSNQQKVNLVDLFIKESVVHLAQSYKIDSSVSSARDAAVIDATINLTL